jgi:hypothetical protein
VASSPCTGWGKRFAQIPNAWVQRLVMMEVSGCECRVLLYYLARTWGDFDARRGTAGRPWVRLSSREIGAEIGLSDSRVRKATAKLIAKHLLRRYRPAAGRRPAAIGPELLLPMISTQTTEASSGEREQPLDEVVEGLSTRLRGLVQAGGAKWQA